MNPLARDPLVLARALWPDVRLYDKQREMIRSVMGDCQTYHGNKWTVVPAGNKLGKDFVAGMICLLFFLTRQPCRIVTTSAGEDHLKVLWGEIGRFVSTAAEPLDHKRGGPLVLGHQRYRKVYKGQLCDICYIEGMVASDQNLDKFAGHHATPQTLELANLMRGVPLTLFVGDECSSLRQAYIERAEGWAQRYLLFGNTWDCDNEFKWAIKGRPGGTVPGGDVLRDPSDPSKGYYRRIVRIKATDSPNVRYGLGQERAGLVPDDRILFPGVKTYGEYKENREHWDPIMQCVRLDAEFYEGAENLMFPPLWLNASEQRAAEIRTWGRKAKAIGIDPAEGGDKTAMCAVDEYGVIELVSRKTPDTSLIVSEALAFIRKHAVAPDRVCFDRGGGGKQHADYLRQMGYPVRTVAFGESLIREPQYGRVQVPVRRQDREEQYEYVNRRAQMYGELRELLDPNRKPLGEVWRAIGGLAGQDRLDHGAVFAIPAWYPDLRQQLAPIPLLHDREGRLRLLPKHKNTENSTEKTLVELLGRSPDEADALALAVHGLLHRAQVATAGVL